VSPRFPSLTATRILAILRRHGFYPVRQSGSHVVVRHDDGRWTTVPIHKGRDLPKGTLRQILKDTGLTIDDLG
jgi:predicted RNA binding protein YcfA (HicA-like mRNA interferase family)